MMSPAFTPQLMSDYFFNDPPSPSSSTSSLSPTNSNTGTPSPPLTHVSADPSPDSQQLMHDYPLGIYDCDTSIVDVNHSPKDLRWGSSEHSSIATTASHTPPSSFASPLAAPKAIRASSIAVPSHPPSYHHYHSQTHSHQPHHRSRSQTAYIAPSNGLHQLDNPQNIFRPFSGQSGETDFVGPFTLGEVLGRGCTGVVRLGTHKVTGFEVAFKIIDKQYLNSDPKLWKKVKREIAILKLIEHPHVLRLYDVLETANRLYLVLEHVKGGELFDYIVSRGRLDRNESLRLIAQIVSGLSYCHSHQIAHRDLKPENLLLDEHRNIKIADFGMAQLMRKDSILKTSCGSPHYASPEIIEGLMYDARVTDVWSIGVILYALITGSLPFDHDNIPTLLAMVTKGHYTTPAHVPDDIKDLISKMLTVDPDKRIRLNSIKSHPCFHGTDYFKMKRTRSWPYKMAELDADDHFESKQSSEYVSEPKYNKSNIGKPKHNNNRDEIHDLDSIPSDELEIDNLESKSLFVDDSVLPDLEALGLSQGSREELKRKISSPHVGSEPNLEQHFYRLLQKRRNSRLEQLSVLSPKCTPRRNSVSGSIGPQPFDLDDSVMILPGPNCTPSRSALTINSDNTKVRQPISPLSLMEDDLPYRCPPVMRLHSAPNSADQSAQKINESTNSQTSSSVPSAAAYYTMLVRTNSPPQTNSLPPSPIGPIGTAQAVPQSAPCSPKNSYEISHSPPQRSSITNNELNRGIMLPSSQQRSRNVSAQQVDKLESISLQSRQQLKDIQQQIVPESREPARKSWFSSIFSSRSTKKKESVTTQSSVVVPAISATGTPLASEYSCKSSLTIANDVRKILKQMNIRFTTRAGYIFDCEYFNNDIVSSDSLAKNRDQMTDTQKLRMTRRRSTSSMEDNVDNICATDKGKKVQSSHKQIFTIKTAPTTPNRTANGLVSKKVPGPALKLPSPRLQSSHSSISNQSQNASVIPTEKKSSSRPGRSRTASADSDQNNVAAAAAAAVATVATVATSVSDSSSTVRFTVEIFQSTAPDSRCIRFFQASGDEIAGKQLLHKIIQALKL